MENCNEFIIQLGCVRDVEDFVTMSTVKPYPVFLDDGQHRVNGKSFMEMFCLSLTRPLRVTAECDEVEFRSFCNQISRFHFE